MAAKATKSHNACPPSEFGGPVGAGATVVALPVLVLVLAHWAKVGYLDLNFGGIFEETFRLLFFLDENGSIISPKQSLFLLAKCKLGLLGWFFGLVVLWKVLPGPWVEGSPVVDPEADVTKKDKAPLRLKYKLNGHLTFWTVMILVGVTRVPLNEYLYRHYERLAFVDILLCFVLSGWLYLKSFAKDPVTEPNIDKCETRHTIAPSSPGSAVSTPS